jgi:hypothetical protein
MNNAVLEITMKVPHANRPQAGKVYASARKNISRASCSASTWSAS